MKITPNPNTILTTPIVTGEVKHGSLILTSDQDKNSKLHQVVAIGSKFDKRFDLTLDSKVILQGGCTVIIDNITYIIANDNQVAAVIS